MFKFVIRFSLAVAVTFSCIDGVAQSSPDLLVVNQGDRDVSVVDLAVGRVIGKVPVGGVTGHEVAVTPDGRTAFVPVYGNSGVGRAGTDGNSMAVVDVERRMVKGTVDFGHGVRRTVRCTT